MMDIGRWIAPLLLLAACGEGRVAGIPPQDSSGAVAEGIEITGTLSREVADSDTLLLFAFVNVPPDIPPQALEPASVSAVTHDRRFGLSNVPPGSVTIVLLTDKGHDGAIDPGDPIAVLDDPYRRLAGLQAGDQVTIKDVTIDGAHARAAAAVIKVQRAAGQLRWEARRPRDLFRPAVRAVYISWEPSPRQYIDAVKWGTQLRFE